MYATADFSIAYSYYDIGNKTWIGIGATVSNNVSICGGCIIGAGAVVIRDVNESGTYVGVPIRKIK